jgi:hypothetical protein
MRVVDPADGVSFGKRPPRPADASAAGGASAHGLPAGKDAKPRPQALVGAQGDGTLRSGHLRRVAGVKGARWAAAAVAHTPKGVQNPGGVWATRELVSWQWVASMDLREGRFWRIENRHSIGGYRQTCSAAPCGTTTCGAQTFTPAPDEEGIQTGKVRSQWQLRGSPFTSAPDEEGIETSIRKSDFSLRFLGFRPRARRRGH